MENRAGSYLHHVLALSKRLLMLCVSGHNKLRHSQGGGKKKKKKQAQWVKSKSVKISVLQNRAEEKLEHLRKLFCQYTKKKKIIVFLLV